MRAILTAGAVTTLLTAPAFSQSQAYDHIDGFGHGVKGPPQYHQPARNDDAYKAALDKIPEQRAKADPWGTVREKPANPPK